MQTYRVSRRALLSSAIGVIAAPGLAVALTAGDALGHAVVRVFDPAEGQSARAQFITQYLSEAGRTRWRRENMDDIATQIATASGGLDFVSARADSGLIRIVVRTRRQGLNRSLLVRVDRDDPDKIFAIATIPMPMPYDLPGPEGRVSATGLAVAIDRRIRFSAERDDFSGAVRITAPDGATIYEYVTGFAEREQGVRNAIDTRFHLGSADKSFTALMIGRLVATHRLTYETLVADVLPNYPNAEFARACTIRHLLTHMSGLGGLFERPRWDRAYRYVRMADLFPVFAEEPTLFAPGARAEYSNEGFIVLGAVIEAVTGRSWYDLLSEQIYAPAQMTRSAHLAFDQAAEEIAIGYRYRDDDHLGLNGRVANGGFLGRRGNSCGGGYSTVRDMTSYLRALRAGMLLPREALEPMIAQAQPGLRNYGMGFVVNPHGDRRVIGHGGGGPHSGVDGDHGIVWETGWSYSILGNFDAPAVQEISRDVARWLAAM